MKHLQPILAISTMLGFVVPLAADESGIYNFTEKNSAITINWLNAQPSGAVAIPSEINGKPVTVLGNNAFGNGKNMTQVSIPSSVTTINSYTFIDCKRLTNLTIPSSLNRIDESFVVGCANLASINVDPANPIFSSADGVLLDKFRTRLICFPPGKNQTLNILPPTVSVIEKYAFWTCKRISLIEIPPSITTIHRAAFMFCEQLESVTIPASVTEMSAQSFSSCAKLSAISVDPQNPVFSSVDGVLFSKDKTRMIFYPPGRSQSSYPIPPVVKSIEQSAFVGCQNLVSVTIPESVTIIQSKAFRYCPKLEEITFLGNAPTVRHCGFTNLLPNLRICHLDGKSGFTSPTWQTCSCVGKSDPSARSLSISRTFVNTSGVKLDGTLVELYRSKIKVKRNSDGKVLQLEIASLSSADQEFIKGLGPESELPTDPQAIIPIFTLTNLGHIQPTPQSVTQETSRLEAAAATGDSEAQLQLADRCRIGTTFFGGAKFVSDLNKANEWLEKAATGGHCKAQFELAALGGSKADEWLKKSAAGGYAKAQFLLACRYGNGDGVPRDDTKWAEWLNKAAMLGDGPAQIALARAYMDGGKFPRNLTKAAAWAQKAVENNDYESNANFDEDDSDRRVIIGQGTSILTLLKFGLQKITVPVQGVDVQVEVIGKGKTGVVFFNNSGPMNSRIADNMSAYAPLLAKGCTILLWSYPPAAPFDKVQTAIGSWMGGTVSRVDFTGIATEVMKGIRSKTGLKNFLLVGNSLGSGVLMWDYPALSKDEHLKFLLISPTEIFTPDPAALSPLKNGVVIANEVGDNFVKNELFKKWIVANKGKDAACIRTGHLIIGENLSHSQVVAMIQQVLNLPTIPNNSPDGSSLSALGLALDMVIPKPPNAKFWYWPHSYGGAFAVGMPQQTQIQYLWGALRITTSQMDKLMALWLEIVVKACNEDEKQYYPAVARYVIEREGILTPEQKETRRKIVKYYAGLTQELKAQGLTAKELEAGVATRAKAELPGILTPLETRCWHAVEDARNAAKGAPGK